MEDCIFCKIARGEIPSHKIGEDELTVSFLDIAPVNPGHALVITKNHYASLTDIPAQELQALAEHVQRVARAVVAATGAEGYNVLLNNGACAGQVVPHAHFHVIPRKHTDGYRLGWRQGKYAAGEAEALSRGIREAMQARKGK